MEKNGFTLRHQIGACPAQAQVARFLQREDGLGGNERTTRRRAASTTRAPCFETKVEMMHALVDSVVS